MKETLKIYFPLILTALCTIYAIYTIFYSVTEISQSLSVATQKNNQTYVAQVVGAQPQAPIPTPTVTGHALMVGQAYSLDQLFALESEDTALYLVDIRTPNGLSILTKLSSSQIETLQEIPSAAIYDTENHLLYFHNSGVYTFLIRLYYDHRPGVLFECHIPVETR